MLDRLADTLKEIEGQGYPAPKDRAGRDGDAAADPASDGSTS
jgi:hypothetical protein